LDELDPPSRDKGENVIEEASHENKVLMISLPFDEVIQGFDTPAQEKVNTISFFPFQVFDDVLFCDLEVKRF